MAEYEKALIHHIFTFDDFECKKRQNEKFVVDRKMITFIVFVVEFKAENGFYQIKILPASEKLN